METFNELIVIVPLTDVEKDVVLEKLSDPVVRKYLKMLARADFAELALLSVTERNDSEVSKKHSLVQGKLSAYTTLLSIKPKQ